MTMGRSGRGRSGIRSKGLNKSDITIIEEKIFNRIYDEQEEAEAFAAEYVLSSAESDLLHYQSDRRRKLPSINFADLKDEYAALWAEMAIKKDRIDDSDRIVDRIIENKNKYQLVEKISGVPWYVIAVIHTLEANGNFDSHLHNGDPLTAKTVQVPSGRPTAGQPPFSWEESALDALHYDHLTSISDWSVEHIAFILERFNGWGYRKYHSEVKSPYLWSFSNHYVKGKYVADGKWSPTAISKQCGAMVIIKRLIDGGHLALSRNETPLDAEKEISSKNFGFMHVTQVEFDSFSRDLSRIAGFQSWPVQTQLVDGSGIFGYYPASKRWGTRATVAALEEIGRIWLLRHPTPHPRVPVGDISLKSGGDIDGHASHETGRDVDMRPMRSDGKEGPVQWWDTFYSRSLTQELIDLCYCNGIVRVKVIGFNDPNVQGCVNWNNHDNHLHVRFFFEDEAAGYPTLKIGLSNNPAVREFQRRLNVWLRQGIAGSHIAEDGDFGQKTMEASQAFQNSLGLVSDGEIGRETWEASLSHIV